MNKRFLTGMSMAAALVSLLLISVPTQADEPTAATTAAADELTIPETGTPADYFQFVQKAQRTPLHAQNREDFVEKVKARVALIADACDKVITMKDATDQEVDRAAQLKINNLLEVTLYNFMDGSDTILGMPDALEKAGRKELAETYRNSFRPYLFKLYAFKQDKDAFEKLADKLAATMEEQGADMRVDLALSASAAAEAANGFSDDFSSKLAEKFDALMSKSDNASVMRIRVGMLGEKRFNELPGKEMVIAGKLLDGTEFNFESYKGKIVLVDFWATWCGPCVREMANVKKLYAAYHDKGFDVIGISCDSSKERLEKFLTDNEVKWAQMLDSDTNAEGFPMSEYYNVRGIPTMVLIGKDGKVLSNAARGETLEKLLADAYGPMEEEKADAEAEK